MEIYFDNSATTRIFEEALAEMVRVLSEDYGNPSSLHRKGVKALQILNASRREIATKIGGKENEIFFTSGGTEGNNLLIQGLLKANTRRGKHVITSMGEHPSVLETLKQMEKQGYEVTYLPLTEEGIIDYHQLKESLREDTILVSLIHVNNETGALHDLQKITTIIGEDVLFHSDGVQGYCKTVLDVRKTKLHAYTVSGHKIGAPKGVGAIYLRQGTKCEALQYGGSQEKGLRNGTENTAAIAAMSVATKTYREKGEDYLQHMKDLKDHFLHRLLTEIPQVKQNGFSKVPHIINISFQGIKGEILLHALEGDGIFVSTGSACSSKKEKSHVLTAMGERADGALRFSFSPFNTLEEVDYCIESLKKHTTMLRTIKRR